MEAAELTGASRGVGPIFQGGTGGMSRMSFNRRRPMARFYKTSDNALLNLDHVLVIQERDGMAVFRNTDAKVICEDNSFEMIAEEVVGQVFPAAPGWFALTFFPEDEHGPAMF